MSDDAALSEGQDVDTGDHADFTLDLGECQDHADEIDDGDPENAVAFASAGAADAMVDPTPKLLSQFDPRWAKTDLHEFGKWGPNGCHPTNVALVLRWISEKTTAFKFPTAPSSKFKEDQWPKRMCEAFWPELDGKVPTKGGRSDYAALWYKAEDALGMKRRAAQLSKSGDLGDTLKRALASGPVVVNIPDHYITVHGFSGGKIYCIDGGFVLERKWKDSKGKPPPYSGKQPAGSKLWDSYRRCYIAIDANETYTYGGRSLKLLSTAAILNWQSYRWSKTSI